MIKDIMVHLDGSPEDEARLEYGQAIASTGRAHLIGAFTNLVPDVAMATPFDGGPAVVQILSELEEQARKEGDAMATRLAGRLTGIELSTELRRFDGTQGSMSTKVAEQARCADVFVATRPFGVTDGPNWLELVEAVLFGSGRGLLIVPPDHHSQEAVQTILVAWNGSREAARALSEALNLFEQAIRVIILMIDPQADARIGSEIKAHLARHGVRPEILAVESRGRRVADVVLEEANRACADLVVMGGYGHTRLREQMFGGATLDMLTITDRPVLLAH